MTAEVGIMNRSGIALAADSAITVVTRGTEKIWTSAEKLFLLAENAPVGMMVYGEAHVLGLPWETIIKVYRRKRGGAIFATLDEYTKDFLSFLSSEGSHFPASAQEEVLELYATFFFGALRRRLDQALESEIRERDTVSRPEIEDAFTEVVEQTLNEARQWNLLDNLPENFPSIVREEYHDTIEAVQETVFGSLPSTAETKECLAQIIAETFCRYWPAPSDSGIVIAGFGEEECLPSLVEIYFRGIISNRVLFTRTRQSTIGDVDAYIAPFAQEDMVSTFMEGQDPALNSMIQTSVRDLFEGVSKGILEEVKSYDLGFGEQLEESVLTTLDQTLKKLFEEWNAARRAKYSDPIMNVVASLPKDELAAMAESLVNMTKFKRRVSTEQETVGGPIDVAVITKGDGFVWIKRKHYFRPELNPRFMSRYYERRA